MTPVNNPVTAKERNYNKAHIATRGKVERMFGVWKQRFRCLRIPLRMHFENSLTVIVSTACLQILLKKSLKLQWNLSSRTAPVEPYQETVQNNELLTTFFYFGYCILTSFSYWQCREC